MSTKKNRALRLSIINEIASIIISTDNIDTITNFVLDLILGCTKARNGSVLLLNGEGNLIVKASKGINHMVIPSLKIKIGERICGKVAEEKSPLLVKDITSDKRIKKKGNGKYNTSSFISCPILIREKLLGVINVTDKIDESSFTEDEFDLVNIIARQTAVLLEYSYLVSELRSKTLELDERNKTLIDCDRLKNEFIAIMSHEFRTPLNSLAGAAYYLKDKQVPEAEQRTFINIISDETNKLINLFDRLLNFSLVEKELPLLNKKILNLESTIKELTTSKIIKEILAKNNISFKASCTAALPEIVGEKARLIQAIIHLIDSIARYTAAGDSIDLRITGKNAAVEISLFVKGREIPENELPFLFDERSVWAEIDVIKNRLQFYLAKKIIELHHGTISVFNAPEGITVKVSFPKNLKEYRTAEIDELSDLFLSFTAEAMNLNKCSLMFIDESTGELTIKSAIGFDEDIIRKTKIKFGDKIAGWVASENKPLLIEDIEKHTEIHKKNSARYNTKSLLCLPIVANNKVIGVLNLNNKASGSPFNKKDLYFATVIADRFSHIIEKTQRGDVGDHQFKTMVNSLESLLNAERKYKKRNGAMPDIVLKIMQKMQRSEDEIKLAIYASAFYDLGLTQIDESILMKSRDLSDIEEKIIRTHPFPGVGLINQIETDDIVRETILHHHERYDGSGYPDGLKGKDIPFLSRVFSVADTYNAMISDRPYRKAFGTKEAVKQIKEGAGTTFDPQVVDAFIKIIRKNHISNHNVLS